MSTGTSSSRFSPPLPPLRLSPERHRQHRFLRLRSFPANLPRRRRRLGRAVRAERAPPPENTPRLAVGSNLARAPPSSAASSFPPPSRAPFRAPPFAPPRRRPTCVPSASTTMAPMCRTPNRTRLRRRLRRARPPRASASRRASGFARVLVRSIRNASPTPPTSSSSTLGAAAAKCRVPFEPGETLYLCVGERRVPDDGGTGLGEEKEEDDFDVRASTTTSVCVCPIPAYASASALRRSPRIFLGVGPSGRLGETRSGSGSGESNRMTSLVPAEGVLPTRTRRSSRRSAV